MKKFLAILLTLALFSSLAVSAYAAGSPVKSPVKEEVIEKGRFVICRMEDDSVVRALEENEVRIVEIRDADDLGEEDREAFLKVYEDLKTVEGKAVKTVFWAELSEGVSVADDEYVRYEFECKEDGVEVMQNGISVESKKADGGGVCSAKLSVKDGKIGAVALLCAVEK